MLAAFPPHSVGCNIFLALICLGRSFSTLRNSSEEETLAEVRSCHREPLSAAAVHSWSMWDMIHSCGDLVACTGEVYVRLCEVLRVGMINMYDERAPDSRGAVS